MRRGVRRREDMRAEEETMVLIHSLQCLERSRREWEKKREEEMRGCASKKMRGEETRFELLSKDEKR
jgi:hypothetical protein